MWSRLVVLGVLVTQCLSYCDLKGDSLKCDGESIDTIVANFTEMKGAIRTVDLDKCHLPNFGHLTFDFPKIRSLKLSCLIQQASEGPNLPELLELNLSHNVISHFANAVLKNSTKLEKLDISHNSIRNLSSDTFVYSNSLKVLRLTSNLLTGIDLHSFDMNTKMEELYLNHNKILILSKGTFDKMQQLKVLDVSNNLISALQFGLFDANKKLEYLVLGSNPIGTLPVGILANNRDLLHLDVGYTQIIRLDEACGKLMTLILSGNALQDLSNEIVYSLSDLKHLELTEMKLVTLPTKFLTNSSDLVHLDISKNRLTELEEDLLAGTNVAHFNASQNEIKEIPVKLFQNIPLKIFDMSYNKLEEIKLKTFNMTTLQVVSLRGNCIYKLHPLTFAGIKSGLEYLDIRDNRLVSLDPIFFSWVYNLKRMEFVGNPWDCACFFDLLKLVNKNGIGYTKGIYFDGVTSVCVSLQQCGSICSVDKNRLKDYYNEFIKIP